MVKSKEEYVGLKRADKNSKLKAIYFDDDISRSSITSDLSENEVTINRKLDEANQKFLELEEKIEETKNDTKTRIDKELEVVRQKIDESKTRVVETLGLFVALFTFLSLQVQIFKDERNIDQIIGLVLITGGLITFFVLVLDIMIKNKDDAKGLLKTRFFLLLIVSLLLVAAGILIMKLD